MKLDLLEIIILTLVTLFLGILLFLIYLSEQLDQEALNCIIEGGSYIRLYGVDKYFCATFEVLK